jgi:nicotinate-nucleotide adenylyltransferase
VLRRLGVLGGTFDPPHLGHLVIAEEARSVLGLDRVLFMPAASPPHKRVRAITPAATRVAMTRVAVRGNPAFEVSTIESRRRGPSYTVDTLRELKRLNPRTALTLILGEDSLRELGTWREPEQILTLARLAVARRTEAARSRRTARAHADASVARRLDGALAGRVRWLATPLIAISSTDLRARARRGRTLTYLVPAGVERYVRRHGLYRRRP